MSCYTVAYYTIVLIIIPVSYNTLSQIHTLCACVVNLPLCLLFSVIAGDDYESGPYCVDFAEGHNKSCVQIPIIDDDIHEPTQDFDVSIDVPDGLPLVPGKNITITITDDDRELTHIHSSMVSCICVLFD